MPPKREIRRWSSQARPVRARAAARDRRVLTRRSVSSAGRDGVVRCRRVKRCDSPGGGVVHTTTRSSRGRRRRRPSVRVATPRSRCRSARSRTRARCAPRSPRIPGSRVSARRASSLGSADRRRRNGAFAPVVVETSQHPSSPHPPTSSSPPTQSPFPGPRRARPSRRGPHARHPRPRAALHARREPPRLRARPRARERRLPRRRRAADNVDLRGVLREWELAHEAKHGRRPTLAREVERGRKPTGPGEGMSAARVAAAPRRAGATAGAERRRPASTRARRSAGTPRWRAEPRSRASTSRTKLMCTRAQTLAPAQFDLTPGHPLLRRYAEDGPIDAPEGGTALSNARPRQATSTRGEGPFARSNRRGRRRRRLRVLLPPPKRRTRAFLGACSAPRLRSAASRGAPRVSA